MMMMMMMMIYNFIDPILPTKDFDYLKRIARSGRGLFLFF
jgi:hypothetical protein